MTLIIPLSIYIASVYIISVLIMYFSIRKAYSKGGDLENEKLKPIHLIATFIPLVNTLIIIINFFIDLIISTNEYTTSENLSKFYKIKK